MNSFFTRFPLVVIAIVLTFWSCSQKDEKTISPNGTIAVTVFAREGKAFYTVAINDSIILDQSALGLVTHNDSFSENLSLVSVSNTETIHDDFTMAQGKRKDCEYEATKRTYQFANKDGAKIDIIFQVSNDGVAFRYSLNGESETETIIIRENSSYNFLTGTTAFLQPMSDPKTGWSKVNPCYEEFYQKEVPVGTPSLTKSGWVYPALFHSGRHWMLVTEAGLDRNYCGTRLSLADNNTGREYFVTFPDSLENFPGGGVNPTATGSIMSPWRIITIGSLKTIIESDLGVALADKPVIMDSAFIKPGHSSWSWALLKDDSTVFNVQKKFIDHSAEMKWEYCLIDTEWDKRIGYEKIQQLSTYAGTKGVGLILWYNSSGSWNETVYSPKDKLLTHEARVLEFKRLNELGIKGIKVDFFGGDGQSMIAYYLDILKDAADFKLLVNFHGSTIPRGWHRTYPNLMSMEAVKGFEYVTFEQGNADEQPSHCVMLPFTRNVFDPMDFTPLSLDSVPRINRRTTPGFELALPVVFLSGIQHLVETPTGMKNVSPDVREFLKELPTQWDDSKFISGYPGKDIVIARRKNNQWFIAGINGENSSKTFNINLDFAGVDNAVMFTDTDDVTRVPLKGSPLKLDNRTVEVKVKANGGFLIVTE
jgi:alpha-glucosidase